MADSEGKRMTIGEHLDELRKRLLVCTFAVLGCGIVAFWRISDVFSFVRRPLDVVIDRFEPGSIQLVEFQAYGGFVAGMKLAFFGGAVVASPVILHQMWAFVSAGLYKHERRAVKFYAIPGFLLFLGGAFIAYRYVMPYAIEFLIGFSHEQLGLASTLDVNRYVSMIAFAMLVFGLLFQLPVVMVFLMRIGAVEPDTFAKYRRHSIVASFAIAMVLTPPDVISQIALAVCMSFLYEVAILIGRGLARPRRAPPGGQR